MDDSKIIDLDPGVRLGRQTLDQVKEAVDALDFDETESVLVIFKTKNQNPQMIGYGGGWDTVGYAQAFLEDLRFQLLDATIEREED